MKRRLYFFTAEYPYGNVSETFIENEIKYLSDAFDEVVIIPSTKENNIVRNIPNNVRVEKFLINTDFNNLKKYFFRNFNKIFYVYMKEALIKGNFIFYIKNIKFYLDFITRQFKKKDLLAEYFNLSRINKDDVLYDFWYINSAPALSLLKQNGLKNRLIVRAHRYDLYDSEWRTGKVPFVNLVYKLSDVSVFSNKHGANYFVEKLNIRNNNKISINYLGVEDYYQDMQENNDENDDFFTIVSCSGMSKRKRVDLIPKLLYGISEKVKWVHFGDGPERNKVEKLCERLPDNIEWQLKGHVDNNEVLEFYKKNKIDLFVSFTTSEGLPVSFKEVQSFGIPILSTNVCGIPDIVNEKTGVLIQVNEDIKDVREKLRGIIKNYPFDKDYIHNYFLNNFYARKVYPNFIKNILLNEKN